MSDISFEIIQEIKDIELYREFWEAHQWNPYYDIDWLIFKYSQPEYKEVPYILIFKNRSQPICIIAGELKQMPMQFQIGYKRWNSAPIKTLYINRYGVLGNANEIIWQLLGSYIEKILTQKQVEAVLLRDFDINSYVHKLKFSKLPFPCKFKTKLIQEHWFVETFKGLGIHKSCHRSFWKHVRNLRNRIFKGNEKDAKICLFSEEYDIDTILKHTEQVAKNTWQRRLGGTLYNSNGVKKNYSYWADRELLRAYIFYINEQPTAFSHGLEYAGKFYWQVMGYDSKYKTFGLGTYLTACLIEDCIKKGLHSIDCGVGNSEAKRLFCDSFFRSADCFIIASTPKLIILNIMRVIILKIHLGLKSAFVKGGLYKTIRSIWRYRKVKI